jgi:hypothetical protein
VGEAHLLRSLIHDSKENYMHDKQVYQITVTLNVADHDLGRTLIGAIDEVLRSIQSTHPFHWFCEGERVPFKVYQQCEFNALMAIQNDMSTLGIDDAFDFEEVK